MRSLTKQNVLWVVMLMLVVTAGVGIWAVFSDEMGDIQARILITTGTISGACILMLPCLAHTESSTFATRPGRESESSLARLCSPSS